MEGNVSGFPGMIVLNSQNYSDWKIKMEDLLIVKDLYEPIEKEERPNGVVESEWKMLHRKAVETIRQCVDISVLQHVASDTNAFELWHKLSALYERKNALNKTFLMRKIVNLKYVVVKKTVHKRNRRNKAWEPALHTHARQEEYKDEVGTCEDRSGWIRLVCS